MNLHRTRTFLARLGALLLNRAAVGRFRDKSIFVFVMAVALLSGVQLATGSKEGWVGGSTTDELVTVLGFAALYGGMAMWMAADTRNWPYRTAWIVGAFTSAVIAIIEMFALLYLSLSNQGHGEFRLPMTRVDALYLSVTTLTTVGSGSVVPEGQIARLAVTIESLMTFLLIAVGLVQLMTRVRSRAPS